jgi:RNA-directed DNA polymerase
MNVIHCDYKKLISVKNLLKAWKKFKRGKGKKPEVMRFERNLEDNLFLLYEELKNGAYRHRGYKYFKVADPKKRDIHKAAVRDRIVHQSLYEYLCRVYEPFFIENSYSSRLEKGTHRAVLRLGKFADEICAKNHHQCCALKCDIRKYFENINHKILLGLLTERVEDEDILKLLEQVIKSFNGERGAGLPLGNVTSQIFANIYLNELDHFVEKELKVRYYVRYNDDFVILAGNENLLSRKIKKIVNFIQKKLRLEIPNEKIIFRKLNWGIDFCGCVVLPNALLLRQKTKRRMLVNIRKVATGYQQEKISFRQFREVLDSYFGLLAHCNTFNLKNKIKGDHLYGKLA